MTLTRNKFVKNFLIFQANRNSKVFNKYSNYNIARLIEGLKDGVRGPMYIINGKLLNSQGGRQILTRNQLMSNFRGYFNYANNASSAGNAFNRATIYNGTMSTARRNLNSNFNVSWYNNLNKPSQLKLPKRPNHNRRPTKYTKNGVVVLFGNTYAKVNGVRYPYVTANNAAKVWNAVSARKTAPKKKGLFRRG